MGPGLAEELPGKEPGHRPGGRHQEHGRALLDHQSEQFRKSEIVTGGDTRPPPGQVEDHRLLARGEQGLFLRLISEQVDFSIPGEDFSMRVDHYCRVVEKIILPFDETPEQHMGGKFRHLLAQGGEARSVKRLALPVVFRKGKKTGEPQFRQEDEIAGRGGRQHSQGFLQPFLFVALFL